MNSNQTNILMIQYYIKIIYTVIYRIIDDKYIINHNELNSLIVIGIDLAIKQFDNPDN